MTSDRLGLTDDAWEDMATILAEGKPKAGRPPEPSDRRGIEAVLSVARPGIPWRDVPADGGQWDAVDHRCRRGEARGIWTQVWERLQSDARKIARKIGIDRPLVRAHQHAAGA
jgi:transposase